jgi:hypothetical protein
VATRACARRAGSEIGWMAAAAAARRGAWSKLRSLRRNSAGWMDPFVTTGQGRASLQFLSFLFSALAAHLQATDEQAVTFGLLQ